MRGKSQRADVTNTRRLEGMKGDDGNNGSGSWREMRGSENTDTHRSPDTRVQKMTGLFFLKLLHVVWILIIFNHLSSRSVQTCHHRRFEIILLQTSEFTCMILSSSVLRPSLFTLPTFCPQSFNQKKKNRKNNSARNLTRSHRSGVSNTDFYTKAAVWRG